MRPQSQVIETNAPPDQNKKGDLKPKYGSLNPAKLPSHRVLSKPNQGKATNPKVAILKSKPNIQWAPHSSHILTPLQISKLLGLGNQLGLFQFPPIYS
jgi:hypothetical protein